MSKIIELTQQNIAAREDGGAAGGEKIYTIQFVDKVNGDVHFIRFGTEVRDALVRQLTGGIILAGGDLPKL